MGRESWRGKDTRRGAPEAVEFFVIVMVLYSL